MTKPTADDEAVPDGCTAAPSHMTGNVWKLLVAEGDEVVAGQPIVVVEAMKMEMEISAPVAGRIVSLRARQGRTVRAGDVVAVIAGA